MSVMDIHADLITELEAALDVSKMLSVFTSVVGIMREQQIKIDDLSSRIKDYEFNLANNDNGNNYDNHYDNNPLSSETLLPRLLEIEKRLDDFEAAVKGNGIVDVDLLNATEVSPYFAFQNPIFETTTNDESDAGSYKHDPEDSLSATSSFKSLPEHDFDEVSFDPSIEMKELEEMPSIFSEEPAIMEEEVEEEEEEEEDEIIEPKQKPVVVKKATTKTPKVKEVVEEEEEEVEPEEDEEEDTEPIRKVVKKKAKKPKKKKPVVVVEEEEEEEEESEPEESEEEEDEPEPVIIRKVVKKEKTPKEPKKPKEKKEPQVIVEEIVAEPEFDTEPEPEEEEEDEEAAAPGQTKIPSKHSSKQSSKHSSKHSSRASSARKTPRDETAAEGEAVEEEDVPIVEDDGTSGDIDEDHKIPSNRSSRKPSPASKTATPPRADSPKRPPSAKPGTQSIEEEEEEVHEPEPAKVQEVAPPQKPKTDEKKSTEVPFAAPVVAAATPADVAPVQEQPINWKRISKVDRRTRKKKGGKHVEEEEGEDDEDSGERPTSAPNDHDHHHSADDHAHFMKTSSTDYTAPPGDAMVSFELPDNVKINKKKYKQKKPAVASIPEPEHGPMENKILDLSGVALPTSSRAFTETTVDHMNPDYAFKRRQMNIANLPWLTQNRAKKIVKKLKNRGRFMLISRNMLEERRKKYSQQSLKQKIDYLEADLTRTQQLVNKLREVHKKDHIILKEGFSYFNAQLNVLKTQMYSNQHNLEQMVKGSGQLTPAMMGNLDLFFGQMTQKTGGMSNFFGAISTFMETFSPLTNAQTWQQFAADKENHGPNNSLVNHLTQYLKQQVIIPETTNIQNTLYEQIAHLRTLSDNVITKQDINNMLKLPTDHSSAGGYGTGNTDGNHQKLVNIINKILFANQERMDLIIEEKMKKMTHSLGMGQNVATYANTVTTHDLEKHDLHLQQFIQHKINEVKDDLDRIDNNHILRVHHVEEDVTFMKDKITSLDHYREENNQELEKLEKARQQETEQLRILQKRIANLSIDKLLDDLKSVHKQLQERPSVDQVTDMIDGIEMTFKEHLGENVQGLKSLVNQVYRHIQHKVDREDIRKLIAARLAQMEKEILNREEELYTVATSTTTRCLSCGQAPRESWQVGMAIPSHSVVAGNGAVAARPVSKHRRAASPTGITSTAGGVSDTSPPAQRPMSSQHMDDELNSISSEPQHPHRGVTALTSSFLTSSEPVLNPYSQGQTNDVYALLTGQAGLRPIQLQRAPMQPIKEPHLGRPASSNNGNTTTTIVASNKKKSTTDKIPEPMYRKAKMTAHMKEMVKVQASGLDTYGYNHLNPMYVMEGSVSEQPSGMLVPGGALEGPNTNSVYSSSGGSYSARETAGGSRTLVGSQSLTNLPSKPVGAGLFAGGNTAAAAANRPPSSTTTNNINALRQGISIPIASPANSMANTGKRIIVPNNESSPMLESPVVRTGGQRNSLVLGNSAVPFDPDLIIAKARLNQG